MEPNTVVYPPNKNVPRILDFSNNPVIYDHLLYLDFNKTGEAIAGSSNLNGTLWEGSFLTFKDCNNLIDLKFCGCYISSTASDGKFLNDHTVVLSEDTGILNIVTLSNERKLIESVNYFKHCERAPSLAVWKNDSKIITCAGKSIYIWDANNTVRKYLQCFENYHSEIINSVDALTENTQIFASAGTDQKCCIWDMRNPQPASVLYNNEFSVLTSVAFNQSNSNHVVVGTEAGDIYVIDKREPGSFYLTSGCFDNNIHRIAFNHSNLFAVCGDLNEVVIFKCDSNGICEVYKSLEHEEIVRGLAWFGENLYSCGFDRKIIKHVI